MLLERRWADWGMLLSATLHSCEFTTNDDALQVYWSNRTVAPGSSVDVSLLYDPVHSSVIAYVLLRLDTARTFAPMSCSLFRLTATAA